MNNIEYTGIITRLKKYTANLAILCENKPFPGKTARFSTNIIGAEKEKWEAILRQGDQITISGSIAEAKGSSYGDYIAVRNPIILGAKRIKTEEINIWDADGEAENREESL